MTMIPEASTNFIQNRLDVAMCIYNEQPYMPEGPVVKGFRGIDVGYVCFFLLIAYRKIKKEEEEKLIIYIKGEKPLHPLHEVQIFNSQVDRLLTERVGL